MCKTVYCVDCGSITYLNQEASCILCGCEEWTDAAPRFYLGELVRAPALGITFVITSMSFDNEFGWGYTDMPTNHPQLPPIQFSEHLLIKHNKSRTLN